MAEIDEFYCKIAKVKVRIPILDRVDEIHIPARAEEPVEGLPEYTLKKVGKIYDVIKRGESVGTASNIRDAKRLVKEDVIYSEWIDYLPCH